MWNTPTEAQLATIPRPGSQSEIKPENVIIYMHFFVGACDWWISEYNGDDVFFGFVNLGDPEMAEWGTISFSELQELKVKAPLINSQTQERTYIYIQVDTDKYWQPKKFSEIWPLPKGRFTNH